MKRAHVYTWRTQTAFPAAYSRLIRLDPRNDSVSPRPWNVYPYIDRLYGARFILLNPYGGLEL